jgi:hypothetical protein
MAVLRYEEAANSGFLLLSRRPEHQKRLRLSFDFPFSLRDIRGVRKMLQVSDEHLGLLCDGQEIHGFTSVGAEDPDTFVVQFYPHGMWELKCAGVTLLQMYGKMPATGHRCLDERVFTETVQAVFARVPDLQCHKLWALISTAARQPRGTNVLISPEAAAEAARLDTQCTRISPTVLDSMLMERLTAIDGTVIIDTSGVCHAIGAILDGPATAYGDRTRGGRYNSAVMYVHGNSVLCMIVVVSQNGSVDLVYDPRVVEPK